jgi:hypothetical protein
MARRLLASIALALALLVAVPGAALACGGLIAPGHAEVLRRATTLAAWHDGYEHYVTGFEFAGSASSFGYIIPLPGEPSKIEKGGDWTLERLQLEVNPVLEASAFALATDSAARQVAVLQRVKIEALDITVVKGGGREVAAWAGANGFDLTPDTPEVLGAYSDSGAIFALAKFDNEEAARRGFVEGQGTVIHFTIPTEAPWVPLRILALGKHGTEVVAADLFLLTDERPRLEPDLRIVGGRARTAGAGWTLRRSEWASETLLADLRSDEGMGWMPSSGMWLTALTMVAPASSIGYDLSINGGGPEAASAAAPERPNAVWWPLWIMVGAAGLLIVGGIRHDRPRPAVA